ncbi:hypothetical protein [Allomesorhizobium alhagi]|jgi:hypothetical protein|uniref:Uncharacterized protein n=1 Tax=Mesorhizobium alhagi CCNWXJ12-2 TaxID=1107882 RepID=H0I0E7_9HYPH|nr:hypothetical protein [Mesorhizobium alhagi]EHK53535.1 hypothetical protein MAXJ12_29627 [Mesorhizobium alhagi CCNWXJ12-2]
MQKLVWPAAFIMCAIAGMFLFKGEISAMISRISTIDRNGITLVQQIDNVDINLTVRSVDELTKARDGLANKAREMLGMHPVALAYFVRSADCSFWNAAEISRSKHEIYLKELSATELSDVYLVNNQETKNGFGGPGIQVVHRDKGKFLLMAFGVEPDPCSPANGATVYR